MNFWIEYSENELVSINILSQRNKTIVKCVIYSVNIESLCINKSIDYQLPIHVNSNMKVHCCIVTRVFCEDPLLLILLQDSKLDLKCYQLDIETNVVTTIFNYNCKERIESIYSTDGPIISFTTSNHLSIIIDDFTGYFKIFQYNNKNNDDVYDILYLGKSICSSTVNQQLIYKNNNEYKIIDIDIFNVTNPIIESVCDDLYTLVNQFNISSFINESNKIIIITNDNKVVLISQDNYNDRIVIDCDNINYIKYYQPNLLYKGYIINTFEIIDIDSEKQSQLLIPNEKIDNLNDIVIISNCVLYIMKDNNIYITNSFTTKQYNIIDNKITNIINDGNIINKVLSSISLKYNEMVENILNNNEIENHKIDVINQIFDRNISLNINHININYDRKSLEYFIPSNITLSNLKYTPIPATIDQNIKNKKCELIENRISITYESVIAIELKINNCSKYELKNWEIMVISNGILYSNIYNIKQQTEHILPSQNIDVQIECNLNHSENILPTFINIYFVCDIDNNQYIEYLINYNLSNVIINHNNTNETTKIYNKTLLLWRESIPKDIINLNNIIITKMNEKCYKIQYNSNNSQFLLLVKKYFSCCTCDLYTLKENVDIDSCFDIFSNEINLLKYNNNQIKVDPTQIQTSKIMKKLHQEICLECIEKLD